MEPKPQPTIQRLPLVAALVLAIIGIFILIHDVPANDDWSGGIAAFVIAGVVGGLSYLSDIGVLPGGYKTKLQVWKKNQIK